MISVQEQDDRALFDMAEQQLYDRETIWVCPYCGKEVGHEPTRPCCGEMGHEIEVDAETGDQIETF
jgi:rubrerythrin